MNLEHISWTKSGRRLKDLDTNKRVYKSAVGQLNVESQGQFKPFVRDDVQKVYRFAGYELRLTSSGLEIWKDKARLDVISIHPEYKQADTWHRETAVISGLSFEEIDQFINVELGPKRRLKISYDVTISKQNTKVIIDLGCNEKVGFAFNMNILEAGEQRLVIDFDNSPVISKKVNNGLDFQSGALWVWKAKENDDRRLENYQLIVNEKAYQAAQSISISPDTYNVGSGNDDGYYNSYTGNWSTHTGGGGFLIGKEGAANPLHGGLRFDNINQDGDADSGCKISIYCIGDQGNSSPIYVDVYADDTADPIQFLDGTQEAGGDGWVRTTNGVTDWNNLGNTIDTWYDSPSIETIIDELFTSYSYTGSEAMAFELDGSGSPTWRSGEYEAYIHADSHEAILTIVTTGAANKIPAMMDLYRQMRS